MTGGQARRYDASMYDNGSGDYGPVGNLLFFAAIGLGAVAAWHGIRFWWRGDNDWRNAVLPIGEDRRYVWETILDLLDQGVAKIRGWWRR